VIKSLARSNVILELFVLADSGNKSAEVGSLLEEFVEGEARVQTDVIPNIESMNICRANQT
jgi:hypothetical protein